MSASYNSEENYPIAIEWEIGDKKWILFLILLRPFINFNLFLQTSLKYNRVAYISTIIQLLWNEKNI